jgi:hypothetical protein
MLAATEDDDFDINNNSTNLSYTALLELWSLLQYTRRDGAIIFVKGAFITL